MFSEISLNDDLNTNDINLILKRLFDSNFLKMFQLNFQIMSYQLKIENSIIDKIIFKGIKADKIKKLQIT